MNTEAMWVKTADGDFELDDPPVFLAGIKSDLQKVRVYYDHDYDYDTGCWLPRPKVIGVEIEYASQRTFILAEDLMREAYEDVLQAAFDHINDGV